MDGLPNDSKPGEKNKTKKNRSIAAWGERDESRAFTVFLKMRFQPSKGILRGSHSTSTEVSLTDLNFRPSGWGRSIAEISFCD